MISIKYKKIYDEFIKKYEEIHVNPWHEISKDELNDIYKELVNKMDIVDEYNFGYFMNFIIKRLSGLTDAHTKYSKTITIPLNFRMFGNDILVDYPNEIKGSKLISINNIPINQIINELDSIITYGTDGKKRYEIEKALFNKSILFGLPSLRNGEELEYEFIDINRKNIKKRFKKEENYNNMFNFKEYEYGHPGEYKFIKNALVYKHSSVQDMFKEQIEESIKKLQSEDLSNIYTFIIDIRGNSGGNSLLNSWLMNFIKNNPDKELICLTDYRVFSSGSFALMNLIDLGATTIGEEIGTPINSYGNSNWFNIDDHRFSVSKRYFNRLLNTQATTKEEFSNLPEEAKKAIIFHPDILVEQTKEDYINGVDTILEYALNFIKGKKL